ncbi:MAG: wax ester/triacylglycerol synthase family O-acyltransferase [Nevskiales bacterium]
MKRMKLLDTSWLMLEAKETPMHVGVLLFFSPPAGAPSDYVARLVARLRASANVIPPWDLILPAQAMKGLIPLWLHQIYLDMDYHVQHHLLPTPGGERELKKKVTELHARPLDLTRPLWECHVIEGLADGSFAICTKLHHALVDGIGGLRLMQRAFARAPDERSAPPWTWAKANARRSFLPSQTWPSAEGPMSDAPPAKSRTLPHIARAARELTRAAFDPEDALATPYSGPRSLLNGRITERRLFATQAFAMPRIKALAQQSGGSANDIVLALCAGAMRRLLSEADALPRQSLNAAIPYSMRSRHDDSVGTALAFFLARLGTEIADPRKRLTAIQASTVRAKEHLAGLPREALAQYTLALMVPFVAEQLAGAGGRFRPVFNVVISNVPGPKQPLYLEGARLEALYPLSVLFHGQALNITCLRYLDTLHFGFTGCPDTVPKLGLLPAYSRSALTELEATFAKPHRSRRHPVSGVRNGRARHTASNALTASATPL